MGQPCSGRPFSSVPGFLNSAPLTFCTGKFSVVGTVLGLVGCLAASVPSAHWLSVHLPTPSCDNQNCLHMLINVPGRPNCPVENHCSSLSCSPGGFLLILPEPFQIPSCPGSLRSSSSEAPVSLKQSPTPTRKALRRQFTHCSPPRLCGDGTLCAFGSLAQGLALERSLLSRFFSFKQKLDLILGVMPHSLQDLHSPTRD